MNEAAMQEHANWCERQRLAQVQHLEWMESHQVRVYSTVQGVQTDVTDSQIENTKDIIQNMVDLLAVIEREHGIKPQNAG